MKTRQILFLFIILVLTALVRVWMPWVNFSPIGAIALIGGAFYGKRLLSLLFPLGALFIGDLILSGVGGIYSDYLFSSGFWFVYLGFALIVGLGVLISKKKSVASIAGMSLIAAVVFFLVTNFGAWMFFDYYPKTFSGLMSSYVAGIPFIMNTLVSQLVFSVVLYLGLTYSFSKKPVLA